ncbi:hypothetical protein HPP92_006498 [Vanilla planifolia]|uniref:Uncharacterized protein n=1 Tax=Vanilla planifolia TaxID=51239 RepID=A0A835RIU5_VANPL|nr:hypothetical protein HPP92_006498 [Vanilla planifolia]
MRGTNDGVIYATYGGAIVVRCYVLSKCMLLLSHGARCYGCVMQWLDDKEDAMLDANLGCDPLGSVRFV